MIAADDELLNRLVPRRTERLVIGVHLSAYGGLAYDGLVVGGEEDNVVRQHRSVLAARSSPGWPATVTRPDFVGCVYC